MIISKFNKSKDNAFNKLNLDDNSTHKDIKIDLIKAQKYIVENNIEYIKTKDRDVVCNKINEYIYNNYGLVDIKQLNNIQNYLINKIFGYHILQKYIDNEDISDIRVVSYNNIYVKIKNKWQKLAESFENASELEEYVRYCITKNNGNLNYDNPIITVSDKKYNLRIEAGIEPVNSLSPSLVIRIHRHTKQNNLENLFLKNNMFDGNIYSFLNSIIKNKSNIIICGKGGSGKTSLLRGLIMKIPDELAITTNEETTELYIKDKNIIQREIQLYREEAKKITLEKLTKQSLLMSNDVIIIGEIKRSRKHSFFRCYFNRTYGTCNCSFK